ncbi:MAG: SDR family oxidoreductase [Dehalococcoidia bacterium]
MAVDTGRVAIITGAGSGIGRAAAIGLARHAWRCLLTGRRREPLENVAREVREAGGEARIAPFDVSNAPAVTEAIEETLQVWGRIDLVVNNAGLNVPRRDLGSISFEDWQRVVAANLHGPFLLTQAVLPAMRARHEGTIVNVSSMAAMRAGTLSGPAYSAAKAALNSFTESINVAERGNGIRACAVCPGEVDTPIMERRTFVPSPEARATMMKAEDVADAILLVALMPARTSIELILMRPTVLRDISEDRRRGVPGAESK